MNQTTYTLYSKPHPTCLIAVQLSTKDSCLPKPASFDRLRELEGSGPIGVKVSCMNKKYYNNTLLYNISGRCLATLVWFVGKLAGVWWLFWLPGGPLLLRPSLNTRRYPPSAPSDPPRTLPDRSATGEAVHT
jgi:hypothetical protein